MAKAVCYLCLTEREHSPACKATPEGAVPLTHEGAWRAGVAAAYEVLGKLLIETKRKHQEERYDIYGCETMYGKPCDCGADEWNARVDEALK